MSTLTNDIPQFVEVRDPERIKRLRAAYKAQSGRDLPVPKGDEEFYRKHGIT